MQLKESKDQYEGLYSTANIAGVFKPLKINLFNNISVIPITADARISV